MKLLAKKLAFLLPLAAALFHSASFASCGSAFCSINTDWTSEALGAAEGKTMDLRYERIVQDQPQTGTRRLRVGEIPHDHDEVRTTNQNLLATYSQNFASGWGYSVVLPVVNRDHEHIDNNGNIPTVERWNFRQIGDVRVTGRYQTAVGSQDFGARSAGLIFGLKLPTGRTRVANAEGDIAERSLQPGSGTTDAILGAFFRQQFAENSSSIFAQVQYQRALNTRDDFAAGAQFAVDLGYAQRLGERLSGLLQLNAIVKQRDRGALAEPADSGSRSLFISPGLSYDATESTRVYGFVQVPVRQSVNGVQLTARRALTLGITTRF